MVVIAENYQRVEEEIQRTAKRCGRNPTEIKLLAASKYRSIAEIRAAIKAGVHLLGENYVQEASVKKEEIEESVEWHMVGHLQSNKVKNALRLFSVIQSLDSPELARTLDCEGKKLGIVVRTFVQVNLGGEANKSGVPTERVIPLLEEVGKLSSLRVEGLMVVPPIQENPESVRPYFRALAELQQALSHFEIPNVVMRELCMGMTNDYSVALGSLGTVHRAYLPARYTPLSHYLYRLRLYILALGPEASRRSL